MGGVFSFVDSSIYSTQYSVPTILWTSKEKVI